MLVRVKADAIGLKAEDYLSDRVIEVENIYSGFLEGYISKEQLDYFYEKVSCLYLKLQIILLSQSICSNERRIRGSSSALGIVDHLGKKVKKLIFHNEQVWGYDHEMCSKLWG